MKDINQRIKYLSKSNWPEELIIQQLNVDYELGDYDLHKDIKRQIDENRVFRTIAGFGKGLVTGILMTGILMRHILNDLK